MVTTNDLKSGTRVRLKNGWYATLKDNKRGNIRLAEVEGLVTEIGSVYAHEIASFYVSPEEREALADALADISGHTIEYRKPEEGIWVKVAHTPNQKRLEKQFAKIF